MLPQVVRQAFSVLHAGVRFSGRQAFGFSSRRASRQQCGCSGTSGIWAGPGLSPDSRHPPSAVKDSDRVGPSDVIGRAPLFGDPWYKSGVGKTDDKA